MRRRPLPRLASPWLDQTRELPVQQATNPVWHSILTPTEDKYVAWLRRVGGRFQAKVEETLAKGKMPNLRNFASQYRDAEPELVWRTVCMWMSGRPDVMRLSSRARFTDLEHMFFRGVLDKDLFDKARVTDPTFNFLDLRFMRDVGVDVNVSAPADDFQAAEVEKQLMDVKVFKLRLQAEQNEWRRYNVALQEWGDSTQA